jgi:hypothetical protein
VPNLDVWRTPMPRAERMAGPTEKGSAPQSVTSRYPAVLAAGKPGYRLVNVILATFTGTIPVNVDTVVRGAQVRA